MLKDNSYTCSILINSSLNTLYNMTTHKGKCKTCRIEFKKDSDERNYLLYKKFGFKWYR